MKWSSRLRAKGHSFSRSHFLRRRLEKNASSLIFFGWHVGVHWCFSGTGCKPPQTTDVNKGSTMLPDLHTQLRAWFGECMFCMQSENRWGEYHVRSGLSKLSLFYSFQYLKELLVSSCDASSRQLPPRDFIMIVPKSIINKSHYESNLASYCHTAILPTNTHAHDISSSRWHQLYTMSHSRHRALCQERRCDLTISIFERF